MEKALLRVHHKEASRVGLLEIHWASSRFIVRCLIDIQSDRRLENDPALRGVCGIADDKEPYKHELPFGFQEESGHRCCKVEQVVRELVKGCMIEGGR